MSWVGDLGYYTAPSSSNRPLQNQAQACHPEHPRVWGPAHSFIVSGESGPRDLLLPFALAPPTQVGRDTRTQTNAVILSGGRRSGRSRRTCCCFSSASAPRYLQPFKSFPPDHQPPFHPPAPKPPLKILPCSTSTVSRITPHNIYINQQSTETPSKRPVPKIAHLSHNAVFLAPFWSVENFCQ
jgi:hypothetical protein